jgi:ribosomal protein L29
MSQSSLTKKSDKDLQKELAEKRASLRDLRFNISGKSRNTKATRETKKAVARIMTEQNARRKTATTN